MASQIETGRSPEKFQIPTRWVVLTGPPSCGKDTTIADIEPFLQSSHVFVPEAAPRIIKEMGANGCDFSDQRAVSLEINHRTVERRALLQTSLPPATPAIFNRGMPDVLAYAAYYNEDANYIHEADTHRYDAVFYLDPLGIFVRDGIRYEKEGLKFAEDMNKLLPKAYGEAVYHLIHVPRFPYGPVYGKESEYFSRLQRAVFIMNRIGYSPDEQLLGRHIWEMFSKGTPVPNYPEPQLLV